MSSANVFNVNESKYMYFLRGEGLIFYRTSQFWALPVQASKKDMMSKILTNGDTIF